jgi:hypothetical protein
MGGYFNQKLHSYIMKKLVLLILSLGVAATLFSTNSRAAEPKTVQSKSQKSRGGEKDPNIKSETAPKNSASDQGKAPKGKSNDSSRGLCQIHVDNRTVWWIKIFVDGIYVGTVPPGGDLYPQAISGRTTFYARADFDDGSYRYWGPNAFDCEYAYTWFIGY